MYICFQIPVNTVGLPVFSMLPTQSQLSAILGKLTVVCSKPNWIETHSSISKTLISLDYELATVFSRMSLPYREAGDHFGSNKGDDISG